METVVFKAIRNTDPMVILRVRGGSPRNLLIRAEVYDTVQQMKIIPIQEMKAYKMELRKGVMLRMPHRN